MYIFVYNTTPLRIRRWQVDMTSACVIIVYFVNVSGNSVYTIIPTNEFVWNVF